MLTFKNILKILKKYRKKWSSDTRLPHPEPACHVMPVTTFKSLFSI